MHPLSFRISPDNALESLPRGGRKLRVQSTESADVDSATTAPCCNCNPATVHGNPYGWIDVSPCHQRHASSRPSRGAAPCLCGGIIQSAAVRPEGSQTSG